MTLLSIEVWNVKKKMFSFWHFVALFCFFWKCVNFCTAFACRLKYINWSYTHGDVCFWFFENMEVVDSMCQWKVSQKIRKEESGRNFQGSALIYGLWNAIDIKSNLSQEFYEQKKYPHFFYIGDFLQKFYRQLLWLVSLTMVFCRQIPPAGLIWIVK